MPYYRQREAAGLPIVPVEGEPYLFRSTDVVQLGTQTRSLSDVQLEFLLRFSSVIDRSWTTLLDTTTSDDADNRQIQHANSLRRRLDLSRPATIADLIRRAAKIIFSKDDPRSDGLTLACIAAATDTTADGTYRFLCRDGRWRTADDGLIVDPPGSLGRLLPEWWRESHVLSDEYEQRLSSLEQRAWRDWTIAKGGLREFPLPLSIDLSLPGERNVQQLFRERGGTPPTRYPIRSKSFVCVDHDFDQDLWSYWESMSGSDPLVWSNVVAGLLVAGQSPLSQARVFQLGQSKRHQLEHPAIPARWVLRLQSLPCVVDTFGRPTLPTELFRVTPQNAFLQEIERFISPELDRRENAWLFDLLGVRTDPTATEVPLRRLRTLAASSNPPISALAAIYKTLDRLVHNLDARRLEELRAAFDSERLIYTANGTWQTSSNVVQRDDAGIRGVLTVHPEIADLNLSLWDSVGVAKQASLDRVLDWLSQLPHYERFDDHMRASSARCDGRLSV